MFGLNLPAWGYALIAIALLGLLGAIGYSIYDAGYDAAEVKWKDKLGDAKDQADKTTENIANDQNETVEALRATINELETKNKSLEKELIRETANPIYRDPKCDVPTNAFRLLNDKRIAANAAITGGAKGTVPTHTTPAQ